MSSFFDGAHLPGAGGNGEPVPHERGAEEDDINTVPGVVHEAARQAFNVRRDDAVVADLVFDSLVDLDRRADRDDTVRRLRFGTDSAGVGLAVAERGRQIHVSVTLTPPQRALVEARSGDLVASALTDEQGRLAVELPSGLVSLVVTPTRAPGGRPLQTAWVRL